MDAFKSLVQPLVGGGAGSSMIDGMKLVVLGGTVETARRVSSSAWSSFVNSFFLTAHFSEDDSPYDWLMLWLSRRPEWQRSREFETTTRVSSRNADAAFGDDEFDEGRLLDDLDDEEDDGRPRTRVVFQPTFDTTHTIYYRGHWLRIKRSRNNDSGCEMLSISVVARNNTVLKQLVLQAKREYEAESIQRVQIYFASSYGSWQWTDSRHKRPMSSIVLNPGVKEMLLGDARDFLKSEQWYADRGIPFRRGYLLHGVPGSGKSSLIHAIAGELMLDVYVVSLSSSWITDATLMTLMGRVPSRCILLLEDLDAAFTRSTSRDKGSSGNPDGESDSDSSDKSKKDSSSKKKRSKRKKTAISDVNTLSLSGLLNALDGVAAAEGRLLFATTNHLERLDPALSRPGRMDVWIEFRNASKWQAEALFRNFFPVDAERPRTPPPVVPLSAEEEAEIAGIDLPSPPSSPQPSPGSTLWSLSPSFVSSSVSSSRSSSPSPKKNVVHPAGTFGANNQAYMPPPASDALAHSAPPMTSKKLARLAKLFADSIPDDGFSVAALQGYLLKHKTQPDMAAEGAAQWVVEETTLKERLRREKEEKEERRERKRKERKAKKEKKKEEEKAAAEAAAAAAATPAPVEVVPVAVEPPPAPVEVEPVSSLPPPPPAPVVAAPVPTAVNSDSGSDESDSDSDSESDDDEEDAYKATSVGWHTARADSPSWD